MSLVEEPWARNRNAHPVADSMVLRNQRVLVRLTSGKRLTNLFTQTKPHNTLPPTGTVGYVAGRTGIRADVSMPTQIPFPEDTVETIFQVRHGGKS